ncbi:hypothetical protein HAX54_045169 [Datura stramonium]|uniref:Uncharacterized protein n=1 Tax=Datura stramonium TaxID=4076 RepID=A0ABS8WFM9_DATST|nr:hypothetical protein [Datura stramonium]
MQEDYGIEDNNNEEIELDNNDTPPIPTSRVGQTKLTRGEGSSRGGRPPLPELTNLRRRNRKIPTYLGEAIRGRMAAGTLWQTILYRSGTTAADEVVTDLKFHDGRGI